MIGLDAFLYYNSGTHAIPVWVLIKQVVDAQHPDSASEVAVPSRASVQKKYRPGLIDNALEFGYQWYKGAADTVFTFLQGKYLGRLDLQFAAADGPIATSGTIYWKDWMVLTKFEKAEELEGAVIYAITAKPAPHFETGAMIDRTFTTVP